ncbi:DUF3397 domain-containing protein [Halobacillus fulvus]|nr:DUF3397 domain-containing protein [Halobacillus fulvus]
MSDWLVLIVASVLTMPIPFLIVFYFFARKWNKYKRKAVHQTANLTTPVFILAVHVLLLVLFDRSFFSYIVIFLLLLLGLSMVIQYKLHEELRLRRAFKGFWRVSFLLFIVSYLGLSFYGVVARLFS